MCCARAIVIRKLDMCWSPQIQHFRQACPLGPSVLFACEFAWSATLADTRLSTYIAKVETFAAWARVAASLPIGGPLYCSSISPL